MATASRGASSLKVEEDLMQNPFLRVLRGSFEGLYKHVAERGEATTMLVPCAECLEGEGQGFNQVFMETHVLQATLVPGCYMNMLGQGVDIKDTNVSTELGFSDYRSCEVLQTEYMYDFGNTFCVMVIDKPLIGRFRGIATPAPAIGKVSGGGTVKGAANCASGGSSGSGAAPIAWLNAAPTIEDGFYDQVLQFRKTFVQVPGCEQSTAERIREIVGDTTKKLIRHHGLNQATQQRQLDYQVSRNAYALLHSFVFPHLQRVLGDAERKLEKAIRSYNSAETLLSFVPNATGRGLGAVDVKVCSEHLAAMDREITPHEKIACINEAHSALQRCIADSSRATIAAARDGGGAVRRTEGAVEITGDDVLALFIMAVRGSAMKNRLAHIAYIEMYLQGAAGRSGSSEAARFDEAGYAVSALQAALQFFLEDGNRGSSGVSGLGRGGSGRQSGGGFGAAAFGDVMDQPGALAGLGTSAGSHVQQTRATQRVGQNYGYPVR